MPKVDSLERVRRVPRNSGEQNPSHAKLDAIRCAAKLAFPTADIEKMNSEIERGYQS